MAEEALDQKLLEERGYYRCWPPVQGNLSRRDKQMIRLGEHAEAYITHRHRQRAGRGRGGSISEQTYGAGEGRREWAAQFDT